MATFTDLTTGVLAAQPKAISVASVTTWPYMQIQYIGSAAAATVAVAAGGDMTLAETGVSDVVFDLSTPAAADDTFGELAASINALANWRCFLIGVLPGDSTDNTLYTLSATDAKTTNGLTLYGDSTASVFDGGFGLTNQKFTGRPSTGWAGKFTQRTYDTGCVNQIDYVSFTLTSAAAVDWNIYAVDDAAGTSTLIFTDAWATTALEQLGQSAPAQIKAPMGCRICVRIMATASISTITAGGYITARGLITHRYGGDVPLNNYTGCV